MNFHQKIDLAYEIALGETTNRAQEIISIIDSAHQCYHTGKTQLANRMINRVIKREYHGRKHRKTIRSMRVSLHYRRLPARG